MMKKRFAAWLAVCCLIVTSVMPVSAEETKDTSAEISQNVSVETETDISAETDQDVSTEEDQDTSTEEMPETSAEKESETSAVMKQTASEEENTGGENSENNAAQEAVYTEVTDSTYVEGGNAEDSVTGIQPFAAQSFTGQYGFQLEGLALDMYDQMLDNYSSKRKSDPITFTPDAAEYGLEFDAPAGDSETAAQKQEELREEISYAMSSALGAFLYDQPWVYWLHGLECGWTLSGSTSGGTTHWQVSEMTLTPTMYFENAADDWPEFDEGVDKAAEEISAQFEVSDTDYEKAKKIHDWINERLTYNYDAADIGGDEYLYAHTAYPLFVEGKGNAVVCEGYAKAFKILCNELGVGCVVVSGMSYTSSGSGPHMWNMMSMPDRNYYAVDLTWDDSGDAGYDTYFMAGANTQGFDKTFAQEHVMNTELVADGMNFVLPVLAEEAYEPDEKYYGNGEWDEEQGTYTITYNPAQTAKIPQKVFEKVLDGGSADKITVNIPDLNLSIEGKYNSGNYEFEIPCDVDVKTGIYDTSVILEQTSPGFEEQWKDTETLKIKVEEDMQGFHYINTVVEADGNQDVVFRFKNGTGANRVVSIDGIFLDTEGVDVGENKDDSVYMPPAWLECDLDEGTVTIPARKIYDNRSDFAPYVYKVKLRFTLADGETVYEYEPFGEDFSSVPIDEFQNPGDEAWYFIYRENEDLQELQYINTVVEADGTQDVTFRFKNGTGINEIVSIDGINIWVKNVPEYGNDGKEHGYGVPQENFTYDLNEGTVTISKEWIQDKRESLVPYVYRVLMTYTLADGKKVWGDTSGMSDSVPIDEFQNPGDEAWYFYYQEPEPDVLPGDINLDEEVNSGDLAYMLQVTNKRIAESELSEAQIKAGDVSGADGEPDGTINSGDLAKLLQYINGRIDEL